MPLTVTDLGRNLADVRRSRPVVHAITNWVTANDVANCLQAAGARPILAWAQEEVTEIVSRADALVLNLGTPSPDKIKAMLLAGRQANSLGKPVLFDPVGVGGSRLRMEAARTILNEISLTVIKGNSAEIGCLAGQGGELRGIEAASGPPDLFQAAAALAQSSRALVAASGTVDLVAWADEVLRIGNGHPLMGRLTGMGCMLTAIMAAFAAVESDRLRAAVAALAFFGLAGEKAAACSQGPGSFKPAFMDALYHITPAQLQAGAKIFS